MKVIILDTIYRDFLRSFNNSLTRVPEFIDYHSAVMERRFGVSDAYSFYLRRLGVDAKEIIANDIVGCALNNTSSYFRNSLIYYYLNRSKYLDLFVEFSLRFLRVFEHIVADLIQSSNADVVHCQDVGFFSERFFRSIKRSNTLLVGQIAGPMPPLGKFHEFDIVLSSLPNYVEFFLKNGIPSKYFALGFDPRVLEGFAMNNRDLDFTFVGGLGRHHRDWINSLESINTLQPISLYGYGRQNLPSRSSLRECHHGEVWGMDMYDVLARSKVTLNRHISISGKYANNMRLYEATGMGALLLTDNKVNLSEIFEPGKEVVVYNSPQEAAELANYYLNNADEAKHIAANAQRKTLSRHSYELRMQELKSIYEYHLERL